MDKKGTVIILPHQVILPLLPGEKFDAEQTLDCGQAFRFSPLPDGRTWEGVAGTRHALIEPHDNAIVITCFCRDADCAHAWADYFDCSRDYSALHRRLSVHPVLRRAVEYAPGLRLLRQDGWEALCTFILSQNNHIKRIKGLVDRLCCLAGEKLESGVYSFPTPQALAVLSEEDLSPVRMGFRAKYVLDAARRVSDGEIDLQALYHLPLDEARAELMQIRGVGPKVADCALLYGFHRPECYPRDVWIKRADSLFPDGFPSELNDVAGLAQQYLFHYCRTCPDALTPVP